MTMETTVMHDNVTEISGMSAYVYDDVGDDESDYSGGYYGGSDDNRGGLALSPRKEGVRLPPGWLEFISEDGKKYFHNALTGVTSWEPPTNDAGSVTPAPIKGLLRESSYSSAGSGDGDYSGGFTDERWMDEGQGATKSTSIRWRR